MSFTKISRSRWEDLEKRTLKNGRCHTFYSPNGDTYTGEWRDNLRHGKGTQVWVRARTMYDGEWKMNKRDGFGMIKKMEPSTQKYSSVYRGYWRNDKKEGTGTFLYSSSGRYDGEWVENQRSGLGKMVYENGNVYEGQWLRDKPNGQGMLLLRNGNIYEGSMKDGKKHGHGRFIYMDRGQVYEGFWVDDIPKCGILYEYNRENTHTPQLNRILPVMLKDVQAVLDDGLSCFYSKD
ncbi:MORN repeat-containing protein 3-like [Neoarius graeffei]|uniref:MORN repeat-containing protein 3-like n=1 Tax=Neoarius graeffei TaxID=443677 RepID=UPI00298D5EDE|nr:MORN repeat-containing protein 3-like [Neoarius graeffei]